jgi:protein-S-isoprenylcysteine O-methyltransferase Ste14
MLFAVLSSVIWILNLAVALFGSAGRLDILPFWEYLAASAGACLASIVFVEPDLWRERARPKGKRLHPGYYLLVLPMVAQWIVAGLDRGRYHWFPPVPTEQQLAALAALVAALALLLWAMHVNRFLSSVVRIQDERGHQVITSGPYAWVRHPAYLAALILLLASGLALGSYAAAPVTLLYLPPLVYRTVSEDRFLQANLPGYSDYAKRRHYRILPGIW